MFWKPQLVESGRPAGVPGSFEFWNEGVYSQGSTDKSSRMSGWATWRTAFAAGALAGAMLIRPVDAAETQLGKYL
jgi:hypothetical protein